MTHAPSTLFLADAHLRGRSDPAQQALVRFLQGRPPAPGGVVILGDLFEFLAGRNRVAEEAYQPVLNQLKRFVPFHLLEGNHDFDLSNSTPGLEGAVLHPGQVDLKIGGIPIRLLHGDRSAPFDLGTRLLRRTLQSGLLRFARDRVLPDGLVFRFAMSFANFSRRRAWPGRVTENVALLRRAKSAIAAGGPPVVVFAHTHEALLTRVPGGIVANPGRAVPGGSYLELTGRVLCLRRFPDGLPLHPGPIGIDPPEAVA